MIKLNLEFNPILTREIRTRWRGNASALLVFGFAALFALFVGMVYSSEVYDIAGKVASVERLAKSGRSLFVTAAIAETVALMLLAPILTATTIAGERERGLLEGLQLSPLTPWKIVWGKLSASVTFALVMMVVGLPLTAIAFFLGGVSPGEFCMVFALHLSTTILGASGGLLCSAHSRRANIALRITMFLVCAWVIGTGMFMSLGLGAVLFSGAGTGPMAVVNHAVTVLLCLANPVGVMAFSLSGQSSGMTVVLADIEKYVWPGAIVTQLLLSLGMLWLATRALRRPFAEQYWIERGKGSKKAKGGAGERSWWEIPLVGNLDFSNPVLQREARGKFRMRQAPLWVLIFEGLLALAVLYYYFTTMFRAFTKPLERETIWWVLSFIALFVVLLACAVMGATAFTREREAGTWEAVNLSLLTPIEIIAGKLLAPLLSCLVFSIPLLPLMLPCIRTGPRNPSIELLGVTPTQALGTYFILAATAFCCAAFGMCCSWRCRSTATAVGTTLGGIFLSLTVFPLMIALMVNELTEVVLYFNPFYALGQLASESIRDSPALSWILSTTGLVALGLVLLNALNESMRNGIRLSDAADNPGR